MQAEIISVGTELLLGQIVDTNAVYLAKVLSAAGIPVYRRVTVGDNHQRLRSALVDAFKESELVFTIGGLGPTSDDITRDVLSEVLGDPLRFDEEVAGWLREFFSRRGVPFVENNLRQAWVPTRGRILPNPNGTAPGLVFEAGDGTRTAIALPGPPSEFLPMVDEHVAPLLQRWGGGAVIYSRTLRLCGIGESLAEDKIKDLVASSNPTVAPYAKTGEVHLRVTSRAQDKENAERLVGAMVQRIMERLGQYVYGFDEDTLEASVVRILERQGLRLATAESCTGGMLAARITNVPGSSRVFQGGVVAYSNDAKVRMVGVPEDLILRHGAVSPEVAEALASGIRHRFGADLGVGVTGIAGPDGGTPEKPVGLVYIALAHSGGIHVQRNEFLGQRNDVRTRAVLNALVMVRQHAMEGERPMQEVARQ
ncbi:MAG: competence/damage-inducible protein A [Chthonomonadales bacterium]